MIEVNLNFLLIYLLSGLITSRSCKSVVLVSTFHAQMFRIIEVRFQI